MRNPGVDRDAVAYTLQSRSSLHGGNQGPVGAGTQPSNGAGAPTPRTPYRGCAVKDVHIVVGVLALALNIGAALWGATAWWRRRPSATFWRLLRAGQLAVVLEAILGGVLLLQGRDAAELHVVYGVVPILLSMIAEQFRISAAQMILDARGYENAQAVGELSTAEQQEVVVAIVRREIGVMTLSAFVVVALLARAATVVH